ncbi:DNA-binding domain-containing protein, AraC-type [Opitutaceae bacterium TAV1]|nr:DNA-binding domain-containing protein, AraC-type [Opitutaceae bacterium TAV1]
MPLPSNDDSAKNAIRNECASLNQRLAQFLGDAPAWPMAGVRWLLQRFYYHVDTGDGHRMRMHRHNWFELTLVARGRVRYSTTRAERVLSSGDLFFVAPGEVHQWHMVAPPLILASFQLRTEALNAHGERLLQGLAELSARDVFFLRRRPDATVMGRLHRELWEWLHATLESPLLGDKVAAQLRLFLAEFVEVALEEFLPKAAAMPCVLDASPGLKNEQIIEFVRANLHQSLNQEDIAKHFHYSVRQIARQFHKENGISLGHYIVEQKLQVARQRLATTDQPVKQIALELGYASVSYFCRLFQKYTNNTPGDYRVLAHARRLGP